MNKIYLSTFVTTETFLIGVCEQTVVTDMYIPDPEFRAVVRSAGDNKGTVRAPGHVRDAVRVAL